MKLGRFGVRVFTGALNAVSGQKFSTPAERSSCSQDHVVIPFQTRLDGFRHTSGQQIKEFAAMPMGSGYSVESQLSSEEVGGLQLYVAPRFAKDVKFTRLAAADGVLEPLQLSLMRSPRELDLAPGIALRMSENGKTTYVAPWDWESKSRFEEWLPTIPEDRDNRYDQENSEYLKTTRPAYISDLRSDAEIEQQEALVVSAVYSISVVLRHFEYGQYIPS